MKPSLLIFLLFLCLSKANYDEEKAKMLLFASALTYCDIDKILTYNCGAATQMVRNHHLEILDASEYAGNGQVYKCIVFRHENPPILIHTCSGATSKENVNQLKAENLKMVSYDLYDDVQRARIAKGGFEFYKEFMRDQAMETMAELICENLGYEVVFTGHSAGAAITVTFLADMVLSGTIKCDTKDKPKVSVYTFGMPRIGNYEFLESFMGEVDESYRVVHRHDDIAHFPRCLTDFNGGCVQKALIPAPYHMTTEIFYDNLEMDEYQVCSSDNGEDPNCSNKYHFNYNKSDHRIYFGINVGCLCFMDYEEFKLKGFTTGYEVSQEGC